MRRILRTYADDDRMRTTLAWRNIFRQPITQRVAWSTIPNITRMVDKEAKVEPELSEAQLDLQWKRREICRFDNLEYRYVPWENMDFWHTDDARTVRAYHYPHISNKNNAMLSYTPNKEFGRADRQLTTRPGKYLRKHMPWLTPQEIEAAVARWKGAELFQLQIVDTPEEIERVYREGPRSCMGGHDCFRGYPHHPAYIYGAGDIGVAYYMDHSLEEGKQIAARTLVHLKEKVYSSSVYGDYQTLESLLRESGWAKASGTSDWRGCKLLKIECLGYGWLMPYLDIADVVSEFENHFRIGGEFRKSIGMVGCHSTSGTTYPLTRCYDCADGIQDGDQYEAFGETYCHHCFDARFTYCGACGCYDEHDSVPFYGCVDLCLCETCAEDRVFECEDCHDVMPIEDQDSEFTELCIPCADTYRAELEAEEKEEEEEAEVVTAPPVIAPVNETHTGDLFEYILRYTNTEEEDTDA